MEYIVRPGIEDADGEYEELVRLETNGDEFVIYEDGGESEDALLCRDLATFVVELQRNAQEINRLRAEVRALRH